MIQILFYITLQGVAKFGYGAKSFSTWPTHLPHKFEKNKKIGGVVILEG
jgi:hypothetical protein